MKTSREVEKLIKISGLPFKIDRRRRSKHSHLVLDGKVLAVFNEHSHGKNDLLNIKSIIKRETINGRTREEGVNA